jgi:hypothetical protein
MTVRVPRLPFSIDPLMAEAKRRMRRRRLFVAVLLVVLVGAAIGASVELRSRSAFVATRPLSSALAMQDGLGGGGRPFWGVWGTFAHLRFVPSAPFQVGTYLTNEASQPVTITGAHAVLPRGSVMRPLGTVLSAYCPRGLVCSARGGVSQKRCGPGVLCSPPGPVVWLAPGRAAVVELNLRFLGCPQARRASLQNVSQIEATYRDPAGTIIHQRLGLMHFTLKIDTPHPCSG